jgi:hypothetical protein
VWARAYDDFGQAQNSPAVTILAELPSASAELVRIDATTQGDWMGSYGADGFAIPTWQTNFPGYAEVTFSGATQFALFPEPGPRGVEQTNGPLRLMVGWNGLQWTAQARLTDGMFHNLALYFLDPQRSRAQRFEVLDGRSGGLLHEAELPVFGDGIYYVFKARGHLIFRFTSVAGPDATLAGLFFDPVIPAPQMPPSRGPRAFISQGSMMVVYRRPKHSPPLLEVSDDLLTWRDAVDEVDEFEVVDLGGEEEVTVRVVTPLSIRDRLFLRIRPGTQP